MIICYCIDEAYKIFAEISIQSVKKNNPEAKIVIVSEKPIEVNGADEYYVWDLGGMHRNRGEGDRISNAAYLKLLLPRLPYDKIIFLDGDTICQHPLDDLWNEDVTYIGLCESHNYGKKQAEELGINLYGLSGMMLMRLDNLRKIDFTKKCFELESKVPELKTGWCHEESILNYGLWDKLTFLDKKYNYCFHRQYDDPIDYNDAVILHICGKDKSYMFEYARRKGHYPELLPIRNEIEGKRIAIVGNAKSIFDTKYGKEIDSHDFVIRFNHGVPIKEESQGSKTDAVFLACTLSDDEIKKYKACYLINRSGNYYNRLASFTINSSDRALMKEGLGRQPSTGFMAINICLTFNAKEIDLYGFDWVSPTYYNPEGYKTDHDYDKESEVIKGYEAVGLLKIHK